MSKETMVREIKQVPVHGNDSSQFTATPGGGAVNKYVLLGIMVTQGATTVVLSRYTRSSVPVEQLYSVNHLIVVTEIGKIVLNLILESFSTGGVVELYQSLVQHNVHGCGDALKLSVPALLYFVQNTCTYTALTHLTAPVFQVMYQSKLLVTAAMSVCMLGRTYSLTQWMALAVLSIGVAISVSSEVRKSKKSISNVSDGNENTSGVGFQQQIALVGIAAVVVATFCSALAGVYFEKIVKTPNEQTSEKPSLYIRNMQLAFFSVLVAMGQQQLAGFGKDQDAPTNTERGTDFLHGFNTSVWILVFLQATLGLVVSAVMKYADNVIKGVATGSMVLLSTVISHFVLHTNVTPFFSAGAILIVGSSFVFINPTTTATCQPSKHRLALAVVVLLAILPNFERVSSSLSGANKITEKLAAIELPDCPLVFDPSVNGTGVKCYPMDHVAFNRSVVDEFLPTALDTTSMVAPDRNRSCALVLSSGALLKHKDGRLIDSYDEVIRSNSAPVAGYEEYVGSRTTCMSFNMNHEPHLDMITWAREHMNSTGKPVNLLGQPLYVNFHRPTVVKVQKFYPGKADFIRYVGVNVENGATFCQHVMAESSVGKLRGNQICTSGMLLTLWAMDNCKAVTIFGANQDSCDPHHYFHNTTYGGDPVPSNCTNQAFKYAPQVYHSIDKERGLQIEWHQQGQLFINRLEDVPNSHTR